MNSVCVRQVITLSVDADRTDWCHSKIRLSCNTLSRRRGHGLRHGVDRRASRSHSLERTWLDTSCAAPQTDRPQVNVAAEPLSVCSHRSMCEAVRAKGKRTLLGPHLYDHNSCKYGFEPKREPAKQKARARYR